MEKVELEDLIEFSKTIKVLYIESNPVLRNSALGVFKIFFSEIDTAENGMEGLEKFKKGKYNLIITAINMPNINGVEMINQIRNISKHITVLIISSDEDKEHFINLIKLGIDGYILKPVQIPQFVEVLQKIIEKFKDKQELYEYKINLEHMVYQKTKELEDFNQSLQKKVVQEVQKNLEKEKLLFEQSKMAAMGEMIGNIAHQWRQPLSAISSTASGIQAEYQLGIAEEEDILMQMQTIVEKTEYLSKTIDTFRDFIKQDKEVAEVVVEETIDKILNIVKTSLNSNHIELIDNIDYTKKTKLILSPGELSQVIINIINNAKDAIKGKNKTNGWIKLNIEKNNDKLIITLEDNAEGIPKEILPKIFEPYFTTKHQSQGTGLGLHMSYKIITESLNGRLYAKNTNNGAKFFIELPLNFR